MKKPLRKYEGSLPYFLGCIGVAVVLCAAITFFALNYLVLVLENKLSDDYERQLRNEKSYFEGLYFNSDTELDRNSLENEYKFVTLIYYQAEPEYPCMVYSRVRVESDSLGNFEKSNLGTEYSSSIKAPTEEEIDVVRKLAECEHLTDPGEYFFENHHRYMNDSDRLGYGRKTSRLYFGPSNYIAFSYRAIIEKGNNERVVWDYYFRVNNVYWIVWKDYAVWFILFYVFSLALAALAGRHLFIKSSKYEGNAYRRHMMSAMIHDLKSPLMVISSYAENLKANVHSEKKDYYAEEIIKGTGKLNDMIMNNLHLLALENEQIDLKLGQYDIVKIASDKLKSYEDILKARNIETTVKGKIMARLDQRQMQAAFGNIISNAVDYCKDGGKINIIATKAGRDYKLTVSNTSDPVDKELLEKIWEPFVKGDNARSNSRSSGLGMSIAKGVFEIHKWICIADYDENTKMFSVSVLIPRKRL